MSAQAIINAIDRSPLNRGLRGVDWLADRQNVAIVLGEDIALFDHVGDDTFEIHLFFVSRGRAAIDRVNEATRQMLDERGAEVLFALIPDFRRDVKLMARWCGWKLAGRRDTAQGICELFITSKVLWKGRD